MDWSERIDAMAAGYQDAAILLAAVRHRIFDVLEEEPRTSVEVAASRNLDPRATDLVLHALAAADVLEKRGDGFVLPPDRARILRGDGEDSQVHILGHHHGLLARWARLGEVMSSGAPVADGARNPEQLRDFICGMADIQRRSMRDVVEAVDLSDVGSLIDVGGGPGTAAVVFAQRWPDLRCTVFDLPGPCEIAREQIAAADLQDRIEVRAGDYHVDPLGEGHDVAYLSNIVHSLSVGETARLLEACRRALKPGGRVFVKDFFLDDTRTAPVFAARFAVNMLVGTEGGFSYPESILRELMSAAGFEPGYRLDVAKNSSIIVGTLPG